MKYQYTSVYNPDTKQKLKKRPIVEIELFGKKGTIKTLALIDSGADRSLFNIQFAREIGINLTNAKEEGFIGIGDIKPIQCCISEVEIKIEGIDNKIKITAGFISSDSVNALLGQEGFFDNYRIKFEKDHDVFEIIPVSK